MRSGRWWLGFLAILFLNYIVISIFLPGDPEPVEIPYTVFKQQIEAGNVVEVVSRGEDIQGTFRQPVTFPPEGGSQAHTALQFSTIRPTFADPGLEALLDSRGVTINARPLIEPRAWWLNLLFSFGPTLLLIVGVAWIWSRATRMSGGAFGLGRSRARRYDQSDEESGRITFADVAGIDESKAELVEIVDFLKAPSKYTRLGGTAPKGVLLVGSPGTGKTMLARAVAGEAGVPFFSMGASEFVEMIVGVGASRVRDLFRQAREAAPAIIFIDELDAIGRARGGIVTGSSSEHEQTLNQILTEMDGFSSREGVIVLAATNRPDVLDQALLRPGRFDRTVAVQPPDKAGRAAILRVHTKNVPLAADVHLQEVASSTPGLVGADLRNLVNEAALLAARRGEESVHGRDFLDALEKIILGPARPLIISPQERERIAYHEGGHTILGLLVAGADPVNRVTIQPRGRALGVTYQRPEDDQHNYHERYIRARIIGALGGRAAEAVVYGTRTTGAENDMQQATALARQMVTRWGMSEQLGPVTLAPRDDSYLGAGDQLGYGSQKPYSEATAQLIDAEVQRILRESSAEAERLLRDHRDALERLVRALLDRETLDEKEILEVTGLPPAPRLESTPLPALA
jgi:cell division protease FtsH